MPTFGDHGLIKWSIWRLVVCPNIRTFYDEESQPQHHHQHVVGGGTASVGWNAQLAFGLGFGQHRPTHGKDLLNAEGISYISTSVSCILVPLANQECTASMNA